MTIQETSKLIAVVTAAYPQHFARYSEEQMKYLLTAWHSVLKEYTYEQGAQGVQAFMASDESGFPPAPGQIVGNIHRATKQEDLLPEEAWDLVRKAIRNSAYNSVEEFNQLPEMVQTALASPSALSAWAVMESEVVNSVGKSHFLSAYKAAVEREQYMAKMPESIRALHGRTVPKIEQIDGRLLIDEGA